MNKTSLLAAFVCICFCSYANAQTQKIDSKVEVEKAYEGELFNTSRPAPDTTIPDSLKLFSTFINYNILEKPYRDIYDFNPLPWAKTESSPAKKRQYLLARIGVAYPLTADADIHFQTPLSPSAVIGMSLGHNSFWGNVSMVDPDKNRRASVLPNDVSAWQMRNRGRVDFSMIRKNIIYYGSANYKHSYNTYYGYNPFFILNSSILDWDTYTNPTYQRDSLSHTYQQIGINLGFSTADTLSLGWSSAGQISFCHARDRANIYFNRWTPAENILGIGGRAAYRFQFGAQAALDASVKAMNNIDEKSLRRVLVNLYPNFSWHLNRFFFKAGFNIGIEDALDIHFYPKAIAQFQIMPGVLFINAQLRGRKELISYQDLMEENPWISPQAMPLARQMDKSLTRSIPIDAELGIEGLHWERFSWRVFAGYRYTKQQYYYTTNSDRWASGTGKIIPQLFVLSFANEDLLFGGVEARYAIKAVQADFRVQYNHYTTCNNYPAWGKPALEGNLNLRYTFRQRISASIKAYYRSETEFPYYPDPDTAPAYFESGQCPAFVDLGAEVEYHFNKNLSFFLQGRNLLNSNQQYFLLYRQSGIRGEAGIYLRF